MPNGLENWRQMQGAAYRELRAMGVDEKTIRAAAMDEGVISSLIEMGDTWFDITAMGKGTALKGLVKSGVGKPGVAWFLTLLGKCVLNIGGEGLEENLRQGVSIAKRNRQDCPA